MCTLWSRFLNVVCATLCCFGFYCLVGVCACFVCLGSFVCLFFMFWLDFFFLSPTTLFLLWYHCWNWNPWRSLVCWGWNPQINSMWEKQAISFLLHTLSFAWGNLSELLHWLGIALSTWLWFLPCYLYLQLIWRCEYENHILPTYKRKDFIVLVRRRKKSGAGIMILKQNFVSWMEKVTTN